MSTANSSTGQGEFFAIDRHTWNDVCRLGLNHATVYLVMARGTGRDNSTTGWSAEAAFRHAGIAWRRGNAAINDLIEHKAITRQKDGKRPRYKLAVPADKDDFIWLPNALVTGAADEVPPVARLRQSQDADFLQALINLYAVQDLTGDGGLPRSLLWQPFSTRERVCGYGPFDVIGFSKDASRYCNTNGPLALFHGKKGDKDGDRAWAFLTALERMGLLEWVTYLAESASNDSELIHPLTGDAQATAVADAAYEFASELPGGFKYEIEKFDFVLPIPNHMGKATLVGVGRLRYRPRTSRTSAWYAQHLKACEEYLALYKKLSAGEFKAEKQTAIGGMR